jgi:hypothetical protein
VPIQSTNATIVRLYDLVDVADAFSIPNPPGGWLRMDIGSQQSVTGKYLLTLVLTMAAGSALGLAVVGLVW